MFYELSSEADRDIEEIFDYTVAEHGLAKAVDYVDNFDPLFTRLIENPQLGRDRREILEGLRSISQESHIVFYRILKDRIRVVRVLHGSRDLPTLFSIGE